MQVTRQAKVDCPRCGRTHTVHEGHADVDCVCHTWCQYGEKASDCTLVSKFSGTVPFNGDWSWPSGLHNQEANEGDDTQARTYYCTVHNVYSSKVPILISVDWNGWYGKKAKRSHRMSKGLY
jgi:hypothetical protein